MQNLIGRNFWSRMVPALLAMVLVALALAPVPARAQGLFSPVVTVNDDAITRYELQQRMALLKFLRTPGDLRKEALDRLIDERLQAQATRRAGITLSEDEIRDGVDEFAQRLDLDGEAFLRRLKREGIAPEAFRDFVVTGLAWRELVRARFLPKATITDADIDREIQFAATRGSARVLISEIFLPTNTPKNAEITRELAPKIARLHSIEEFSDAARRFSAGASREDGGRVKDWVMLEDLPSLIRPVLLTMRPGEVTEPIEIPNAVALFQLRAIEEVPGKPPADPVVDYAVYHIAGGRNQTAIERAQQVRDAADTCDDLYGIAKDQPPEVLERIKQRLSRIPTDVALELAKLDPNESSANLTSADGQTLLFLMLCARLPGEEEPDREAIRRRLQSARLAQFADSYLDELRADATILKR